PPCVMVIFGAAGDLTKRKLVPALYNLAKSNLLSREFAVVGVARAEMTNDEFRERVRTAIQEFSTATPDAVVSDWLERSVYYLAGEFTEPRTYDALGGVLKAVDAQHGCRG